MGRTTGDGRFTFLIVAVFTFAGLVLAVLVGLALATLGGRSAAVCADPPLLEGRFPQLLILGGLIASFVAGGLTSGWSLRAVHRPDNPAARSLLEQRRVRLTMRVVFILLFALLTFLMCLEAGALFLHVWPITYYVRCASEANTPLAALGGGLYSFLAGRWLWVRRQ